MGFIKELSKKSVYSIYKGMQLNKLKKSGLAVINAYLRDHKERKLHIGAGGSILEGWLNVDLEPDTENVAYLDAGADYPLPDNSIDFVFSEHLFEHLNIEQQVKMLAEVIRVLKPGGRVRIATPNLDAILNIRGNSSPLVNKYVDWAADTYFPEHIKKVGNGAKDEVFVINNYFYSWGHRFIHNPRTLKLLIEKAGFRNIEQVPIHQSAHPIFMNRETHGNVIPPEFNDMETMVFEAVK